MLVVDVFVVEVSALFFFSPDSARKNVGIERLLSVSDFNENRPTDVIRLRINDSRGGGVRNGFVFDADDDDCSHDVDDDVVVDIANHPPLAPPATTAGRSLRPRREGIEDAIVDCLLR